MGRVLTALFILTAALIGGVAVYRHDMGQAAPVPPSVVPSSHAEDSSAPSPQASGAPTLRAPGPPPPAPHALARPPKLLFGMGDEISAAVQTPLYDHGDVNMVTSWYNGPSDLGWMSGYASTDIMSNLYQRGDALELVVWLADEPSYAISPQFLTDLTKLIEVFKGNGPYYGPMYVILFTEFETYSNDPGYDQQLRSEYLAAVKLIHSTYDQAYVSLGFGGYDWNIGTPVRDLSFWEPAIAASDFTAFQAMQDQASEMGNGENIIVPEIQDAVSQLGQYGKPVMISHFKLWGDPGGASSTFAQVVAQLFSPSSLDQLRREGLFAVGFMDDQYISAGPGLQAIDPVVTHYAGSAQFPGDAAQDHG